MIYTGLLQSKDTCHRFSLNDARLHQKSISEAETNNNVTSHPVQEVESLLGTFLLMLVSQSSCCKLLGEYSIKQVG